MRPHRGDSVPQSQDDVDTSPNVVGDPSTERLSTVLEAGRRVVLSIAPSRPLVCPRVLVTTRPREADVLVEEIRCGADRLYGPHPADTYRTGQPTRATVARQSPLKVVLHNRGTGRTSIDVCLVGSPGAYSGTEQNGE